MTKIGNLDSLDAIGIHEVLEVGEELRAMMMRRANADEIREAAIKNGMVTMTVDGFQKAVQGITTLEEVLRVFHE
jgi:type II secretory ATPase GspE/PulE/Tfp pilus assembly ATPase PilB-like protein